MGFSDSVRVGAGNGIRPEPDKVSFIEPRVLPGDWDRLEVATSSLREPGAREIVGVLRKRNNKTLLQKSSPFSEEREEFHAALGAVNAAFRKRNLPYRVCRDRTPEGRILFLTLRLWRVGRVG